MLIRVQAAAVALFPCSACSADWKPWAPAFRHCLIALLHLLVSGHPLIIEIQAYSSSSFSLLRLQVLIVLLRLIASLAAQREKFQYKQRFSPFLLLR